MRGAIELGLNTLQGNDTYAVDIDKDNVSVNIKNEMEEKFGVQTTVQEFPTISGPLNFIRTQQNAPNAGSRNKILSPLEKIVGKALKKISGHFQNYCNTAERLTGFRHYFAIKNSGEMLFTLDKLKGKAETFFKPVY